MQTASRVQKPIVKQKMPEKVFFRELQVLSFGFSCCAATFGFRSESWFGSGPKLCQTSMGFFFFFSTELEPRTPPMKKYSKTNPGPKKIGSRKKLELLNFRDGPTPMCCCAVAQLVEHPSKGPRSVQLYWREFESRPRHNVEGKNRSSAICWAWK